MLGAAAAAALSILIFKLLQASGMDALTLGGAVALTVPLSLLIVPVVAAASLADVQRLARQPAAT